MDIINEQIDHAQLVKVVNELKAKIETSENNPLNIAFPSQFVNGTGDVVQLRTFPSNTASWALVRPSTSGASNICIGSCVASNQGASIVVPLNIVYYNLTQARIDNLISDIQNNLPLLFPSGTTIRFVYSTLDYSLNTHFYVVSVQ